MRTGKAYIQSLQDKRCIYLNGERVEDVSTHPAFTGIIRTVSKLYDISSDPKENMTYQTEDGTIANKVYMIPRSREDLQSRREAITRWARATCGFVGRSPDHVASFLAGMASSPEIFARGGEQFKDNFLRFYKHVRDQDLYVTYVIIPPQIDRSKTANEQEEKFLQMGVYQEKEDGIVIRGSMMLGTSSAVCDYLFVSCLVPLKPGDEDYAVTFAVPVSTPGIKMYARPSYAMHKSSEFDYPLSTRFDESDSMVYFDDVFVPWENVFVYKDVNLVRQTFHESPAHVMSNSQAQARFSVKLKFLLGVARKITELNGTDRFPQVQERLGELATIAATVEGSLLGAEYHCQTHDNGTVHPNRRFLYGVVGMQDKLYPEVIKIVRELSGGGVLQLPSTYKEIIHPETREDVRRLVRSADGQSVEKIKLFKLAWDIVGSEFGGRHQQYELFYNGAPYVTKGYAFRNYRFEETVDFVDEFMESYSIPSEIMQL